MNYFKSLSSLNAVKIAVWRWKLHVPFFACSVTNRPFIACPTFPERTALAFISFTIGYLHLLSVFTVREVPYNAVCP
jgi:hypothetical protein